MKQCIFVKHQDTKLLGKHV